MAIAVAKRRLPPHLIRPHALEGLVASDGTIDWSPWYLTEEEDMGQSGEQDKIIDVLASSLQVLAEERSWSTVWIGTDNFFAWVEGENNVQVSPDVFVLDGLPPAGELLPRRWETWRLEHEPPRLAVEIVSADWKKDYAINPPRYDHLGVGELVLADQDAFIRDLSAKERAPFTLYRRSARDRLERVYYGNGPAYCAAIEAYLLFQPDAEGRPRARISRSANGDDIVPTWPERAAAQADEIAAQADEIAALRARLEKLESS